MAADLDQLVEEFRHRPLDAAGPFTFVAADALTMKVREGGRVVNAVVLVATGVNGDGHREVLGMRVATSETGAAWNEFFADLVARGLAGVRLVTSDAHAGLVDGIARTCPALGQGLRTLPGEGTRRADQGLIHLRHRMFNSHVLHPIATRNGTHPVRATPARY